MKDAITAKRYAKGLFKALAGKKDLKKIRDDLFLLDEVMKKKRPFFVWLSCSLVPPSKRIARTRAILKEAGCDILLINFVSLLIKRERVGLFADITGEFGALFDEAEGVIKGKLTAVDRTIAADFLKDVAAEIAKKTGKKIELAPEADPSIIGGLKVRIGNRIINMTIGKRLSDMKERLCLSERMR